MLNDLIAVCGYSCARCKVLIATHNNDKKELEKIAVEWTKALGRTYKAEDILCDGCRVPGGRRVAYCAGCNIRVCALGKDFITCADCPECPCEKIVSPKAKKALAALKKTPGKI
jgi:hypothetical protein